MSPDILVRIPTFSLHRSFTFSFFFVVLPFHVSDVFVTPLPHDVFCLNFGVSLLNQVYSSIPHSFSLSLSMTPRVASLYLFFSL